MPIERQINIHSVTVEGHNKDHVSLIFIPDQDQILKAGREYEFVFSGSKVVFKEAAKEA